ncbi:DUF4138 domain-containing protein [Maribacter sp. ANRC-HE7]|uniref:DUF4138 domain-containing protein n=1 Tax=Maribacter aquimaris TaxID=2737171 RepID=A0ABR7V1F6_9FLAO|nr:DUF4138 domain-containing protein [Maribacter aquimaris]MBD0777754.1 DUF4138 domain-containing protein [Maribacter aquimaris]
MKRYILTLLFVFGFTFAPQLCLAQALTQNPIVLDTIYANDQKNVALFFPQPIRQGITGSDNFIFTYNREKEQYFGLLQAKPGKESNLLVINKNGSVFSYIVRYKQHLSRLNYFIPKTKSIGNEKPVSPDSVAIDKSENLIKNRASYYQNFCSFLLDRKQLISKLRKRNEGIVLSIENIVFDKEELYFVIQIKNTSTLDYDLNFLDLSVCTRQKGRKKSQQRIYQEPLFVYGRPTRIVASETVSMVYVLPKFSLDSDRKIVVELNEKNGERTIELKVPYNYINNPN